jgi:hypothetical protein
MRILLLCAALLLAVPSAGIADDTTSGSTDASPAVTDGGGAVTDSGDGSQTGSASQTTATCVQGFEMATCGSFTGCAMTTWQCCPNSSNTGWQWADNSSPCPL